MRRIPLVRAVVLVLCLLVLTSCGRAADLATGSDGPGGVVGSSAPELTAEGGVVVSAADLDAGAETAEDAIPVVVYVEPLCPHCKAFDDAYATLLQDNLADGRITLEYRLVSFLDRPQTQRSSARSVNAALCVAADAGPASYAAFVHALLANQPADGVVSDDALVALASETGADIADCVASDRHAELVTALSEDALGTISATPTVLVGEQRFEGVPSAADMAAALGGGTDVV